MAQGMSSKASRGILEHAKEEQEHADAIAERIVQLGGQPIFLPKVCLTVATLNTLKAPPWKI
jgi:bacterioferritin